MSNGIAHRWTETAEGGPACRAALASSLRFLQDCFFPKTDLSVPDDTAAALDAEYRYERKFVVTEMTCAEIRSLLRSHPALISEIYYERFVNNVYLDSFDMGNYFARAAGVPDSTKVRVRWYGDLFGPVAKPALELKIRTGILQRKERFPLAGFTLNTGFHTGILQRVFAESNLPEAMLKSLGGLETVLLTRYRRSYFLSADAQFRLTIDADLQYCNLGKNINSFLGLTSDHTIKILELKYSRAADAAVERISAHFPFRLYRNSKYVEGLERINPW